MNTCRGRCYYFDKSIVNRKSVDENLRYHNSDSKFCSACHVFIIWTEIRCPCCNAKMRTKPRNKNNKRFCNETRGIFTEGF